MYLDPGTASLVIQTLFAFFAAVLAGFRTSRMWIASLWRRAMERVTRRFRRRDS